ncbi:MAG TPA: VOC family protein [Alphaproteobacteria bacterium]
MDQRLSLITLGTTDLARAKKFYVDGLGWTPHKSSQKEVLFFQLPGVAFALWDRAALAKDAGVNNTPVSYGGISLAYNAPSREEVDAVMTLAKAAGAKITKAAEETPWGGYSGYFYDTEGFLWEVAHNPFWTIKDDGGIDLDGGK